MVLVGQILGVALEALAWWAWLQEMVLLGFLEHLLASLVVAGVGGAVASGQTRRGWALWTGLTALTMPGPGVLAAFLRPAPGLGSALAELREYTRPPELPPPERRQTLAEQRAQATTTELTLCSRDLGDAQSVRTLAEALPELGDAVGVRRLRSLMRDPASDAYHVAAARLARLQEHFAWRIFQAREQLAAEPDSVELQARVGEVYVSFLKSGLLDGVLADFYYRLAVERFAAAARLEPTNPRWELRVAELHRRNGRYALALDSVRKVLDGFPDHMEARMRILEIYYYGARLGLVEATRHFLLLLARLRREVDPRRVADPWLRGAAWWWFSPQGEAPDA